jgi:tetratricopeptide (TPR) repeat protein
MTSAVNPPVFMDLQPQNRHEATATMPTNLSLERAILACSGSGCQNAAFLLLLVLFSFLFQGVAHAQVDLHSIYDEMVKVEHKNTQKAWTDEELSKEQKEIIADYEKSPIRFFGKNIIVPIVAYGYCGKSDVAVTLMKRHLVTNPEDGKIRHLLGITELGLGNAGEAVSCLEKTWNDGADTSPLWLVMAYIGAGHIEAGERFIPVLLKNKNKEPKDVDALVLFALTTKPFDTNLFSKAIEGMTDEEMLRRNDADLGLFIRSLWKSGQEGRARAVVAEAGDRGRYVVNTLLLTSEWLKQVIDNYEANSTLWKSNELNIAASAYAHAGQNQKAKTCYLSFLTVRPNQKQALRGLGIIMFSEHKLTDAKVLFKKAWELGDVESLKAYAFVCLQLQNYDELGTLVPELLKHRIEDPEMIGPVMDYAAAQNPPDKKLFLKAIEGVSDETVLRNADVTKSFIFGLRKFGEFERAQTLQERASKRTTI